MSIRIAAILMLFALLPSTALAHGLDATVHLQNGRVSVEAYFDDDSPAAGAVLRIARLSEKSNPIVTGTMDEMGKWSGAMPPAGKYLIEIEAVGGHLKRLVVTVPETVGESDMVQGANREDFTGRAKWGRAALGLALIAAAYVAIRIRSRSRSSPAR